VTSPGISSLTAEALAAAFGIEVYDLSDTGAFRYVSERGYLRLPMGETEAGVGEPDESGADTVAAALDFDAINALPVLDPDEAVSTTEAILEELGLLPAKATPVGSHTTFDAVGVDGTPVVDAKAIDTTVSYGFKLMKRLLEVPGQKIAVSYDGDGTVTQLTYDVREFTKAGKVDVVGRKEALDRCATQLGPAVTVTDATKAYAAPPLTDALDALYLSYRCEGTTADGADTRAVFVSALAEGGGPPAPDKPRAVERREAAPPNSPDTGFQIDAGTSWIGLSQGLGGSEQNTAGFINRMAGAGVPIQFDYGDENAWETDWKDPLLGGEDHIVTDDVDLTFYTGHANADGFTAGGDHDDDFVGYWDALWGNTDMEWASIAACGPLQVGEPGSLWYERWGPSFDGLHQINGYATGSYDNTIEGDRFASYLLGSPFWFWEAPMPVHVAWATMARDSQPRGVEWASMGVYNIDGFSTFGEHFWDRGWTGPDLRGVLNSPDDPQASTRKAGYWRISGWT